MTIAPEHCGTLIDVLRARLRLSSDRALAAQLHLQPATLSKIRNGKLPLRGSVLLRMHDVSQLPIEELR